LAWGAVVLQGLPEEARRRNGGFPEVNQSPVTLARHGISVAAAQEAFFVGIFEILDVRRIALIDGVIDLNGALVLVAAIPARAAVCMDKSMTQDEIIDAINAARGCEAAMKVFRDCEYGASGDVQLGAAVEKKCEANFLSGLRAAQKKAYASQLSRCDAKYRNESGTMYRSFTAFCRAEVSQRTSQKAPKAGPKAR